MEAATSNDKRFECCSPPLIPQSHPWLVISHGKHRQRQTFYSMSEDRHYVKTIPELRGQSIRANYKEWLVLTSLNLSESSLFNIVSLERIQLPPMQSKYHNLCVLTSSPDNPDCKIVFFDTMRNSGDAELFGNTFLMCKPGDGKFDKQKLNLKKGAWESAIAFNGIIYLLNSQFQLFVVDFSHRKPRGKEIIHSDKMPKVPPNIVEYHSWLVVSDGELLFITMLYYGYNVKEAYGFLVHQFDFEEKSLVEIKGIGKSRAIFLDLHSAAAATTTTEECGIKGNSIYFVKEHDRCLYEYDLEKKMISFTLPCPDVHRSHQKKFQLGFRHSQFSWITIPDVRNKLPLQ